VGTKTKDPTEQIRLKAGRYAGVDKGTACTQTSFKTGKTAFLYIGMQGGRYEAMFKLERSMPQAASLAKKDPDHFEVGSNRWVTARFSADQPMPNRLWQQWLDESYQLSSAGPGRAPTEEKAGTKVSKKTPAKTRRHR